MRVVRDEPVFRPFDHVAFGLLTVVNVVAVLAFARYWLALPDRVSHPVVFWTATLLLAFGIGIVQFRWILLLQMRRPRWVAPAPGLRVGVVTTFVPGAEDPGMLEQTLRALVAMEYPHDTWVLDEGDDPAVRALCEELGARHFSRKGVPHYQQPDGPFQARTKHGNYNAWLAEVGYDGYDVIVNFDPDHVPAPSYLRRVLGYFRDPGIGYVQAAQVYYNQDASFIARGAAEETYAYYSSHQMASYAMGYPIVTGCHTAQRTAALREVGGFAAHDADDLLITLHYRAAGWRGVYVPEMLARGLTPVDWPGYLRQQLRWARSVLDVKLYAYPRLARSLPPADRVLSLLHGCYYFRGVTALVGYAMLVWVLATGAAPAVGSLATLGRAGTLFALLQLSNLYRQRFFLDPRRECGLHWRAALLQLAKWPWLVLALGQVLLRRRTTYLLTPKVAHGVPHRWLLLPHASTAIVVAAAWAAGRLAGATPPPVVVGWAAVVIALSVALVWTETRRFPPPWQPDWLDGSSARPAAGAVPVADVVPTPPPSST